MSDDGRLSDHQARSLLDGLLLDPTYPEAQVELVAYMGTTGDERLISVLIEVLRAAQLGAFHPDSLGKAQEGLFQLTGERLDSWAEWAEWYARSDLTTVPGFAAWKGRIYSRIDPDFARFFDEDAPRSIRFEEIVWGGVHLDGIPPLESAPMVAAHNAAYLEPQDVVFGVAINGDYRAYPLRIMDWHEMANDEVGGEPVALAYCTLCGAGVLFSRRHRGKVLSIGTSGFLMRSNKLMYDRGNVHPLESTHRRARARAARGRPRTARRNPHRHDDVGGVAHSQPHDSGSQRGYRPPARLFARRGLRRLFRQR